MTLIELSVTMMIMGLVVAATVALLMGAQRTTAQTNARLDQIQSARVAVERMSKSLRTAVMPSQLPAVSGYVGGEADAFVRGGDYEVLFYANINNPGNSVGPSRVSYTTVMTDVGIADLVETVQIPDSSVPGVAGYTYCDPLPAANPTAACLSRVGTQVIARGLVVDASAPLITYYNVSGDRLLTGASGLGGDQLKQVLSVEVQVTVQEQSAVRAKPTTYIQRIMLPNAHGLIRQQEED